MKTSNKIVVGAAAVIVVVLIASVVGIRLYIDSLIEESGGVMTVEEIPGSKEELERSYDVRGFSAVRVSGGWSIEIRRGDEHSLEIGGQERYLDKLKVGVKGDTLVMEPQGVFGVDGGRMRARIVMPELESIEAAGGIHLRIRDFSGDVLNIRSSGGSSIEGSGQGYRRMELDFSGGTDLDFRDLSAANVNIHSSGAVNAVLTMRGGQLNGTLSGAGTLTYYGSVSRESVSTEGVTKIERAGAGPDE